MTRIKGLATNLELARARVEPRLFVCANHIQRARAVHLVLQDGNDILKRHKSVVCASPLVSDGNLTASVRLPSMNDRAFWMASAIARV